MVCLEVYSLWQEYPPGLGCRSVGWLLVAGGVWCVCEMYSFHIHYKIFFHIARPVWSFLLQFQCIEAMLLPTTAGGRGGTTAMFVKGIGFTVPFALFCLTTLSLPMCVYIYIHIHTLPPLGSLGVTAIY